jgi:opacity protein-like surface antigen
MPDDRARSAALRADGMESAPVRWVLCAVLLCAFASSAAAQEFGPVLRGPDAIVRPSHPQWAGFYAAGQIGYSSANVNFSTAASPDVSFILRNTTIEADEGLSNWEVLPPVRSTGGTGLGGFVGYNMQWEDIVLGFEANYNHVTLQASSADSEERSFVDSNSIPAGHHYFYDATVSEQASMEITDIATFRARAGWAFSNYLPYGFFGFALGGANLANTASVQYSAVDYPDPTTPPTTPLPDLNFGPVSQGTSQDSALVYGLTTGVGTDIALTQNMFLRAELEYIYFFPIDGIHVTVASARVGAGIKF